MPIPNSPAGDNDVKSTVTHDQPDVVAGTEPDAKDDAAGTSTAAGSEQGAKEPELDLLAVVRKAVEKTEPGAEGTPPDGKDGEEDDPAADGDKPELTEAEKAEAAKVAQEAEDAKLPFHKHPRWQEKLKRERELTEQVTTQKAQIDELSVKAERLDRIGAFMRDNELSPDEMSRGFDIMATMKRDPAKALEMLSPHLEGLELVTGKRLPKDLQERVDNEGLEPAVAQEIARTRVKAVVADSKAQRATATVQTERERQTEEANTQAIMAMKTAVETWEVGVKGRDPDYPKLQPLVTDRLRVLMQATPPGSPKAAVTLAEQALTDVKAKLKDILPRKAATKTVTSGTSSTQATPAPSSMLDIVKQVVSR